MEKEGSARAKADVRHIDGLADLRPSVEAGFHSILKTFVVHTHSVYANLAACSTACRPIAAQAFAGAAYTWGWVPYTDPGANLTFAIRDELRRVEKETGKAPSVILMQNHGIIVHADAPDTPRARQTLEDGQAVASSKTGELLMRMDAKKALTLAETLTAVFFVMEHIRKSGYELSTMGEAAKKFIANWESEKYRKSLAGKKG